MFPFDPLQQRLGIKPQAWLTAGTASFMNIQPPRNKQVVFAQHQRNSIVTIFDHHVVKYTSTPDAMARKYSAMHRVGTSAGFVSPRVLMVEKDHILLERIHNIVSLRELYISKDDKTLDAAVRRAGEVLAEIHVNLPRNTETIWAAPPGFETDMQHYMSRKINLAQLPQSILHGDYGFSNVFVSTNSEKSIVIIDPCPNFGSTFHEWALAPSYLDVGKMFACLEGQIPVRYQRRRPRAGRVSELQAIFMSGYAHLGEELDIKLANGFAFAIASAQFRRRFGKFGKLRQAILYNRVRGNFPLSAKIRSRAKVLR